MERAKRWIQSFHVHLCLISIGQYGFCGKHVLGLVMVTIQAASDQLHPDTCGKSSHVEGGIATMFYTSLCLFALGIRGVRGSLTTLGVGVMLSDRNVHFFSSLFFLKTQKVVSPKII